MSQPPAYPPQPNEPTPGNPYAQQAPGPTYGYPQPYPPQHAYGHPQQPQPAPQPGPYTVSQRRGANHGLHLVLTLLTCGMWAITGWPIAAIMGRRTKTRVAPPRF